MIHAVIALLLQAALGLLTGNWWVGGVAGAAVYLGREHAQAEYRWIERFGSGLRVNMPWWGGLDPKVWNLKSLLDWFGPLLVAGGLLVLANTFVIPVII